jgi:hypothetical protein
MPRVYKRLLVVNIFGGLFYLLCLMLWLWSVLPYLPKLISLATKLQPVAEQPRVVHATNIQLPTVPSVIIMSVVVIAILAITAYVLVKLPVTIGRTGKKLTKGASEYLVPVISHHAKLTPKKRQRLAVRVSIDLKLALCTLPVVVAALSVTTTAPSISYDLVMLVAAVLALVSLMLFMVQLALAKMLHVPLQDLW